MLPDLDWPDVPRTRCATCGAVLNHHDTHTCDEEARP